MEASQVTWTRVPDSPGVYFFLGKKREILYIGKATSLRSRLRSYFSHDIGEKRSALVARIVRDAHALDWQTTDSVLEAMLIEANLIRTHKPHGNTRSKDDKSYNHLVITNEEFPRVLIVRGKDLKEGSEYAHVYGPFPHGALFKDALKVIRKLFQFYDERAHPEAQQSKVRKGQIDFNRQIGLYPKECSKQEYARTIRHIRLLFEGKKKQIITDLTRAMFAAAKKEEFEEANELKKRIRALTHIQDVALLRRDTVREYRDDRTFRIEAYDIAHLSGSHMVGVMVVVTNGVPEPSEYRTFKITSCTKPDDTRALTEVLERRLNHPEWTSPDSIVVDGSVAQMNAARRTLTKVGKVLPVIGVVKDEHHNPKRIAGPQALVTPHHDAILLANAEAHRFAINFHRKRRRASLK